MDSKDSKEEEQAGKNQPSSGSKVAKTAAKGAATYFAGPAGGKAVDLAANTKLGQKVLDKAGEKIDKSPLGKVANKLDEKGIVDAADKVVDMAGSKGGAPGGAPGGATGGATGANPQLPSPSGDSSTNNIAGVPPGGGPKKGSSILDDDKDKDKEDISVTGSADFSKVAKISLVLAVITSPFLLVILIVVASTTAFGVYKDGLGINTASEGNTGDIDYVEDDKEAADFYKRVNEVKEEMLKEGKSIDTFRIVAAYHVLSSYNGELSYKNMSKRKIKKIANAMLSNNVYDEETFKNNLINDIIKSYVPKADKERREAIADEIFQYITDYYDFIGENNMNTCVSSSGVCDYSIKGFYSPSTGNINKNMNVSNLKVRLMQCSGIYGAGTWGQPLQGEDLIDFEKYILGVTYAEIGTSYHDEAIKAQLVAARSWALSRPAMMNNSLGKKLSQENNQWILQLSSCVADQVYCDPDRGCSKMNDGDQGGTIRSGNSVGTPFHSKLDDNSKLRTLAKEVEGEVLVNNQGNIINTPYTNVTQELFNRLAKQGLTYKQILLQVYNQGTTNSVAQDITKMSCGTSVGICSSETGEYATWKQYDQRWADVRLGSKTVRRIGCLATSVSILIAKSGVPTVLGDNFNPGTFVEYLSNNGGFSGGDFLWYSVKKVAPGFEFVDRVKTYGYSDQQRIDLIKNLLSQGYYVVIQVSVTNPQHWVAVNNVVGNQVNIYDPSDSRTVYGDKYPISRTGVIAYFKASKTTSNGT